VADSVLGGLDPVVEPVNCEPVTLGARGGAGGEGASHDVARHSTSERELGRGSRRGGAPIVT
jgi:hypothetical protein